MSRSDDELLARLRRADPAGSLPAADPERVDRLLEDAMSHDPLTESRETGARGRSPLTWLVAAAAVVLIVGVAVFSLATRDDRTTDAPPTAQGDPTVTKLTLPEGGAGRCMVPNARTLANAEVAFDAEVSSIESGVVTLDASQWYAGEPTDEVLVRQPGGSLRNLVGAPRFEEGSRYLLAGSGDGNLMVCGFSGAWTEDLAALYARAFGD